jgi:hypothetical protein
LISAALVATGRTPLGIGHAYTEHYNILRVLYWANLLISIPACWGLGQGLRISATLGTCAALALTIHIHDRMIELQYRLAALNWAATALATDVYDPVAWHSLNRWDEENHDAVEFMQAQGALLRGHHLSIFHDGPAAWLGENLSQVPLSNSGCAGRISTSSSQTDRKGTYQVVTGQVRNEISDDKDPQIILTDHSGTIIGFGAVEADRSSVTKWKGYARSDMEPAAAYLYDGGTLCKLVGSPCSP